MPATSRAVVFPGPGQPLEVRTFPVPSPSRGEILVRVAACTLCGSDLHSLEGRRPVPVPTILGHEMIGRIEAFGPDAPQSDLAGRPLRLGDRVSWGVAASCGRCYFCRHDLSQKCESLVKYGHEPLRPGKELLGGLAEHCLLVRGSAIMRLPASLSPAVACPASCATATVAAALEKAGELAGARVLVVGAGMLGVTACAMARTRGAAEVLCLDIDAQRRERAVAFGATRLAEPAGLSQVVAAASEGRGVDVLLEMSGSPEAFDNAFPAVRTGGCFVLVGSVFPARPVSLPLEQLVRRHLSLHGIHNYAPRHLQAAVDFLEGASDYPLAELVRDWIPLDKLPDALAGGIAASGGLRLGVRCGEE